MRFVLGGPGELYFMWSYNSYLILAYLSRVLALAGDPAITSAKPLYSR